MTMPAASHIRICHFSDLHLPLDRAVPPWRLLGKRALGYANLRFRRSHTHKLEVFAALLCAAVAERADLYVLTGDFANLSFAFEYEHADRLLRDAGLVPERTIVIPGNHDRYTIDADLGGAFERGMRAWLPDGFSRREGYPIRRALGPVGVLALDTAVWRNPVRAAGYIAPSQIARLAAMLSECDAAGLHPVIAMHHPPFRRNAAGLRDFRIGLDGSERLLDALGARRATVLHGHMHLASRRRLGDLDVIGVPSASNDTGDPRDQAAFHAYSFGPDGLVAAETVRVARGAGGSGFGLERASLAPETIVD